MSALTAISDRNVLEENLRTVTERLAAELTRPTSSRPDWSELQWRVARAAASIHGISPLLATRLHWTGPAGWQLFLESQREHTRLRHERIQQLLHCLHESMERAGIAGVALKGAELCARGLYGPGERPMADVDLLVRGADVEGTARVLLSIGFRKHYEFWKQQVFVPTSLHTPGALGEHSENDIKIELHQHIAEALPLHVTELSAPVFPPGPHPGLNRYASTAALMSHLLLHDAGAMASRSLRLLHLNDLARVAETMSDSDWEQLFEGLGRGTGLWWTLPPLTLTARYFPEAIPDGVIARAAVACPRRLRQACKRARVSDVSFSNPRIVAFPGIEWTRSLTELVGYVRQRIRPDERTSSIFKHVATEAWAANNDLYTMSHFRRALRWITSRPARPATLHAVRAALGDNA